MTTARKENLEEARNLAEKINSEWKEQPKQTTITATVNGEEATVFRSEHVYLDDKLAQLVKEADIKAKDVVSTHQGVVKEVRKQAKATNADRSDRLREFVEGYRWEVPTGLTASHLHEQEKFKTNFETVEKQFYPEVYQTPSQTVHKLAETLDGMMKAKVVHSQRDAVFIPLGNGVASYFPINAAESSTTLVKGHDILHADPFNYLRGEIHKSNEKLLLLDATLENSAQQRQDAITGEDVRVAENVSFDMVLTEEKALELMRERLEQIEWARADVDEFYKKYDEYNDEMKVLEVVGGRIEEDLNKINSDRAQLAELQSNEEKAFTKEQEEIKQKQKNSADRVTALTKQQEDIWEAIEDKLKEMIGVCDERYKEVDSVMNCVQTLQQRTLKHNEFMEITGKHLAAMDTYLKHSTLAKDLCTGCRSYAVDVSAKIAARQVLEELEDIKVSEQMRYLKYYNRFLTDAETLRHSRARRIENVSRMERTIELSRQQAVATLDPNSAKYKAELENLGKEKAILLEKVHDLEERLSTQSGNWKTVQEALEQAGIAFDPPEIVRGTVTMGLQDETLRAAKEYLLKEQNMLDKASSELRKLKVSNKCQKESLEKRNAELETHLTPQAMRLKQQTNDESATNTSVNESATNSTPSAPADKK